MRSPRIPAQTYLWLAVLVGIVLRVRQYLFNRSLWLDEAMLSIAILRQHFTELFQTLDYSQQAPVGFVFLVKMVLRIFGTSEYTLRLIPLLCGIAALLLFQHMVRRWVGLGAATVATALFALSPQLLYYSGEVKQYSTDALAGMLVLCWGFHLVEGESRWTEGLRYGIYGAVIVLVSFPGAIALASLGLVVGAYALGRRNWKELAVLSLAGTLWLATLAAYYLISLRPSLEDPVMRRFWRFAFAPVWPLTQQTLEWWGTNFFSFFQNPVGLTLTGLGALTLLIGSIVLSGTNRKSFWLLITPFLLTLLLSALRRYPFSERVILFLAPPALLLMAIGIEHIQRSTSGSRLVIRTLIVLLLAHPAYQAIVRFVKPGERQELRPVLQQVAQHRQPADVIYTYYAALPAFEYYAPRLDLKERLVLSKSARENPKKFLAEVRQFKGFPRIWFVFSHVWKDEKAVILQELGKMGLQLQSFEETGSAAFLYDLRPMVRAVDMKRSSPFQVREHNVHLWSRGSLSFERELPAGSTIVEIYAWGSQAKGAFAHFQLFLDDKVLIGQSFVTETLAPYRFEVQGPGKHRFEIRFDNDLKDGLDDRNLMVSHASFDSPGAATAREAALKTTPLERTGLARPPFAKE